MDFSCCPINSLQFAFVCQRRNRSHPHAHESRCLPRPTLWRKHWFYQSYSRLAGRNPALGGPELNCVRNDALPSLVFFESKTNSSVWCLNLCPHDGWKLVLFRSNLDASERVSLRDDPTAGHNPIELYWTELALNPPVSRKDADFL